MNDRTSFAVLMMAGMITFPLLALVIVRIQDAIEKRFDAMDEPHGVIEPEYNLEDCGMPFIPQGEGFEYEDWEVPWYVEQ